LRPEVRLARTLVARLNLEPPVEIDAIAETLADVEYASIPADCDAVVVASGRPRPLIVVNRTRPPVRRRFSIAHEIGHLRIPWHAATTIACHADPASGVGAIEGDFSDPYRICEAEANRFASELLIPRRWLAAVSPWPKSSSRATS
jgi:Zn-dependent peptidase ImmA (M78 family)